MTLCSVVPFQKKTFPCLPMLALHAPTGGYFCTAVTTRARVPFHKASPPPPFPFELRSLQIRLPCPPAPSLLHLSWLVRLMACSWRSFFFADVVSAVVACMRRNAQGMQLRRGGACDFVCGGGQCCLLPACFLFIAKRKAAIGCGGGGDAGENGEP